MRLPNFSRISHFFMFEASFFFVLLEVQDSTENPESSDKAVKNQDLPSQSNGEQEQNEKPKKIKTPQKRNGKNSTTVKQSEAERERENFITKVTVLIIRMVCRPSIQYIDRDRHALS